jgi:hypothetical protein
MQSMWLYPPSESILAHDMVFDDYFTFFLLTKEINN